MEIINDDEVKFEVNECMKELQVDFIRTESITLNMDFSLAYTDHKLNFEVHRQKHGTLWSCWLQCYIRSVCSFGVEVQFLTDNSSASFSEVEGTDVGYFLQYSWHNNVYCIISLMINIFRFWGV